MLLSYFGELGYLIVFILPAYINYNFQQNVVIHTFDDYANILSLYNKKNVTFKRQEFGSYYRCCAESDVSTNRYQNLNRYLGVANVFDYKRVPNNMGTIMHSPINVNYTGKILLFPRCRGGKDYGYVSPEIYDEIINIFKHKEIVLCGKASESHNMDKYNLKRIEMLEVISACKTADLCIVPDSGFASLLIASGVKKIVIIFNDDYTSQRNTYFHIDVYHKTAKWFKINYYIVDNKYILDFLRNDGFNKEKCCMLIILIQSCMKTKNKQK